MKSCTLLILVVILVAMVVDKATGVCCHSHFWSHRCQDCTKATHCCGVYECNIFCCSCVGGCRQGSCNWKRSFLAPPTNPAETFLGIDVDGDGLVDKAEFDKRVKPVSMSLSPVTTKGLSEGDFLLKEFEKMDKNGDGMISPGEFDDDLK